MKKPIMTLFFTLTAFTLLWGDNISISGIDTSSMIFNGNISVFLTITDESGASVQGLTSEDVNIFESVDKEVFEAGEILSFKSGENELKGINFHFLIDNSGSMYETVDGSETEIYEETRIYTALEAVKTLIQSMQGSNDKTGLALFNTYYKEYVKISSQRNQIIEAMALIEEPGKDESFTELNASVYSAAEGFSTIRGRKILIVLSDGENYPFSEVRHSPSPQFGNDLYSTEQMIAKLKERGTTLYGISFASSIDKNLEEVAISTGGMVFQADSADQLKEIYKNIRQRVLDEYTLQYRSGLKAGDQRFVKAQLTNSSSESGVQNYFSGNLFGSATETYNWLYLLTLPVALLIIIFLIKKRLSNPAEKPLLDVTDYNGSTQVFDLKEEKTIIGTSDNDDVTVVSGNSTEDTNATIVFDEKTSLYTVVSEKDVMVNNNPVKNRVLEPGDVININGATIIFNDKEK